MRFDKDDPRLSWKAYKQQRKDSFDETLAQAPGTHAPGMRADPTTGLNPPLDQMQALIQAAQTQGGVVRLDASDPANAALRDMVLRAVQGATPPPSPPQETPENT